jgi:hypothetical protein
MKDESLLTKFWWLILLLLGVLIGFMLAHALPHCLTAPIWEADGWCR